MKIQIACCELWNFLVTRLSSPRPRIYFSRHKVQTKNKEQRTKNDFPPKFLSIFLTLFFLLLTFSLPASAEKLIIKVGTLAPEGSTWVKAFRKMNQEVEQKTGGQVSFRIFPGGALGDEEDMLRKIRINQIQGGFFSGGGLGLIFKDIKILATPFLLENYQEADSLMARMRNPLEKGFWDNNFKIMCWAESGFIYLLSKHSIKNAADLRKGKVWIWEDTAMGRALFKELEVNPIPLGIPDVLISLQTGMIDTVYASPLAALSMQWFTRVSYLTDLPLSYSVGAIAIHKSALEKIPPAYRGMVEEIFLRQSEPLKSQIRQENEKALEVMLSRGIKRVSPLSQDINELQVICWKAMDTLGEEQFSQKTFKEVKAFLKNIRKKN